LLSLRFRNISCKKNERLSHRKVDYPAREKKDKIEWGVIWEELEVSGLKRAQIATR
jgi:hypothetical protein